MSVPLHWSHFTSMTAFISSRPKPSFTLAPMSFWVLPLEARYLVPALSFRYSMTAGTMLGSVGSLSGLALFHAILAAFFPIFFG